MNRSVYDNGALRGDCNGTDASLIGRTGSAHPGSVKSLSNLVSSLALDWARPDSASGLFAGLYGARPWYMGFSKSEVISRGSVGYSVQQMRQCMPAMVAMVC